jgi:TonB family protein
MRQLIPLFAFLLLALNLQAQPASGGFFGAEALPSFDRIKFEHQLHYPDEAVSAGISGMVTLSVMVSDTGRATVMSEQFGDTKILASHVRDVIQATRFAPAVKKGRPAMQMIKMRVRFDLDPASPVTAVGSSDEIVVHPTAEQLARLAPPPAQNNQGPSITTGAPSMHTASDDTTAATPTANRGPIWNQVDLASRLVYPPEALSRGIEGTVMIHARVDPGGRVVEATVAKTDDSLLDDAALKAVRETRFLTAMAQETPVWVDVPVSFRLADRNQREK